jgi:hypothetical protein
MTCIAERYLMSCMAECYVMSCMNECPCGCFTFQEPQPEYPLHLPRQAWPVQTIHVHCKEVDYKEECERPYCNVRVTCDHRWSMGRAYKPRVSVLASCDGDDDASQLQGCMHICV